MTESFSNQDSCRQLTAELCIETPQLQDDAELDAFLATHFYSSMYLRAQLQRDRDRASFVVGRVDGAIAAVAAQSASGMVLLQAPVGAARVAQALLRSTGRRLAGFFGPIAQVTAARTGMGLDGIPFAKDTPEDLFALQLSALRIPRILEGKGVRCRIAVEADFQQLVHWRVEFRKAVLKNAAGEYLVAIARADIAALLPSGSLFILEADVPLACCSFNARVPEAVSIGNVWTPPELRGCGYARAVVAGALLIARDNGIHKAVLATGRTNRAAQAAYRSIGFEPVGDYATATIAQDIQLPE